MDMREWYQQPAGKCLFEEERSYLADLLLPLYPQQVIQIGGVADHLVSSRFNCYAHLLSAAELRDQARHGVIMEANALPLLPNSIDLAVLIHVLEGAEHPVKFLHDLFQALEPGGHIIILGFNPNSLWGLRKLVARQTAPWKGRFWSLQQVKRWLENYRFTMLSCHSFCYRRPNHIRPVGAGTGLERLVRRIFPAAGGVYALVAKKHVYQPIQRKQWRENRMLRRRAVGSTLHS